MCVLSLRTGSVRANPPSIKATQTASFEMQRGGGSFATMGSRWGTMTRHPSKMRAEKFCMTCALDRTDVGREGDFSEETRKITAKIWYRIVREYCLSGLDGSTQCSRINSPDALVRPIYYSTAIAWTSSRYSFFKSR